MGPALALVVFLVIYETSVEAAPNNLALLNHRKDVAGPVIDFQILYMGYLCTFDCSD